MEAMVVTSGEVSTISLLTNMRNMGMLFQILFMHPSNHYTIRTIFWRLGVSLPSSDNFNPWEIKVDLSVFEEIKSEFGVPAGTGLETWSRRFDTRGFG